MGNTASANQQSGVEVFGNSSGNFVQNGNVLGTLSSDPKLGNKLDGVLVSGSSATASEKPTHRFRAIAGSTIAGNQANGIAINLADTNSILGNSIGALAGLTFLPNKLSGVSVSNSNNTEIAGANIIDDNAGAGINLVSTTSATILNNTVLGNQADGISLATSRSTMILGNTIFHNSVDGIGLDQSLFSVIDGNDVHANVADGIRVQDSSNLNYIGVAFPGLPSPRTASTATWGRSKISTGSVLNVISGNLIGFEADGAIDGNAIGVFLNQVKANTVGRASLAAGENTITGNKVAGVYISGNDPNDLASNAAVLGNVVVQNFIGTDPFGNSPQAFQAGNADVGVFVLNSQANKIDGNIASGNHQAGIELVGTGSSANEIAGNTVGSISSTPTRS